MRFDKQTIRIMGIRDLRHYLGKAELSQGNGSAFSKMLENRINNLTKELKRRALAKQAAQAYTPEAKFKALLKTGFKAIKETAGADLINKAYSYYFD